MNKQPNKTERKGHLLYRHREPNKQTDWQTNNQTWAGPSQPHRTQRPYTSKPRTPALQRDTQNTHNNRNSMLQNTAWDTILSTRGNSGSTTEHYRKHGKALSTTQDRRGSEESLEGQRSHWEYADCMQSGRKSSLRLP